MNGTLYIISAPSGCGKTSLVHALLESANNLEVSISHTTRPPRPREEQDVNYHFISETQFKEMIKQNEFIEYAEVFGHLYGTAKGTIVNKLKQGLDIILEIDWQGARQIKESFKNNVVSIFILPPSMKTLQERLLSRCQDTSEVIKKRMLLAYNEILHYKEYDYLVINNDFELALSDLKAIIQTQRLGIKQQEILQNTLINDLLKSH